MKPIFLVPLGHHTTQGARALTRDGRRQMGLVAETLRRYLRGVRPLLVCPATDVGTQARQIIADALEFTGEEEAELFEAFDFMDHSDVRDLRLTVEYLQRQITNNSFGSIVLIAQGNSIPSLDPAIQHLLWEHTTTDPKRCDPGQFLLYNYNEGHPVLH